jgi:hypothetical protein
MAAAAITAPKSGGQLFLAGKHLFIETVIVDDRETLSLFSRLVRQGPLATDCHRLQPRGSIKAPSLVVRVGYVVGGRTRSAISSARQRGFGPRK